MSLSIEAEQNGNKRILRLKGQLDTQTTSSLAKEIDKLFEGHHKKVIVDFSKIEDLSEDCMQTLLSQTKKFKKEKGVLALVNISNLLMEKIRNAGFLSA